MKVLIVSAADRGGGAFIAARRLHFALRKHGVESIMLVAKKTIDDPFIIGPTSNVGHSIADLRHYLPLPFHIIHKTDNPNLHSFNIVPSNLHKVINAMDVDVVNLHWVNREMMSIADIAKIEKPIVWTLHDMWPLLGAAHHVKLELNHLDEKKRQYKSGLVDLNGWMYWRKKKHWSNKNITFVGPSNWMVEQVVKSRLFGSSKVVAVVNPLDTVLYKPQNKKNVREILGLDNAKKYILFGAMSGTSDPKKGFRHLRGALEILSEKLSPDVELLVFGGGHDTEASIAGMKFRVHALGNFNDDLSLMMLYNAADIFVTSSLVENLPNTVAESLSCGTPVVAFADVGGIGDMVKHQKNGYLAELRNEESLADGIVWALDRSMDPDMVNVVRESAVNLLAEEKVAKEYIQLFKSIMQ